MPEAALVYANELAQHVLRADHPMRPIRLQMTSDLINAYGLLERPEALLALPRPASAEELLSIHTAEYIEAVQSLSERRGHLIPGAFGFSESGDNPVYSGMWEAALLSTGASLVAMELVLDGKTRVAFNPSGGLHHAMASCASGFCIFNDPAVIIKIMADRGLKVAYLDIDAHHGDGVQVPFYETDQVLTISLHESGRWLFPGTGETHEVGAGRGRGYSVNVPFAPYTDDALYVWAFSRVVEPLIEKFRPDVIVTQLGVDAHDGDPLAHLSLTTRTYDEVMKYVKSLGLPWIALGGGGYKLEAVARVWTMEYGCMLGLELPDAIPSQWSDKYGVAALRDRQTPTVSAEMRDFVRQFAEESVRALRRDVLSLHGLV
ncbi:MAG: acetoin utilization protein AcuC [Chloroflexi bacterium]|nr:acetoin utilization protein AcuC [Chloroflexota bacterium]